MNLMTSPPTLQPKQWKKPFSPFTWNDGVFSPWKGHSPFHVTPLLRSCTRSLITWTMSTCDFRSSTNDAGNRGIVSADCRLQVADRRIVDCGLQIDGLQIVDWVPKIDNPAIDNTICTLQSTIRRSALCTLQSAMAAASFFQLHHRGAAAALVVGSGSEVRDQRMPAQELGDCPPQRAGSEAVDDPHRAHIAARGVVEEAIDATHRFLRVVADDVDLGEAAA